MAPARDTLLLKLGAAKSQYLSGWRLIKIEVGQDGELSFSLRKDKLRQIRQREGRYLLRSNSGSENPAQLWQLYILLTQIEKAFTRRTVSTPDFYKRFYNGKVEPSDRLII